MAPAGKRCLMTGAAGFVGQDLTRALLELEHPPEKLILTDIVEPARPKSSGSAASSEIMPIKADLTDLDTVKSLFTPDLDCIILLHGIMSGQSEANMDLGLKVNVDSVRTILDHLRQTNQGVRVVFASSVAVYGSPPTPDAALTEATAPDPRSSYGAQKHIAETLLNDYSRRGLLDGVICRLPTVVVRPGQPSWAASAFASGIFREPLNGIEAVLPVSKHTRLWICAPRTVIRNLVRAYQIPEDQFANQSRIVNLPGSTVSVSQMLEALLAVGGKEARARVREEIDSNAESIVATWPPRLDTAKASSLGFHDDVSLKDSLRDYIKHYVAPKS